MANVSHYLLEEKKSKIFFSGPALLWRCILPGMTQQLSLELLFCCPPFFLFAFQGMQVIYFGFPRLILKRFDLFPSQRTMSPSVLPMPSEAGLLQQSWPGWLCCCFQALSLGTPAPRRCLVQEADKPHMHHYFWGIKYLGIKHEFLFSLVWLGLENTISLGLASFPTYSLWSWGFCSFVLSSSVPFWVPWSERTCLMKSPVRQQSFLT